MFTRIMAGAAGFGLLASAGAVSAEPARDARVDQIICAISDDCGGANAVEPSKQRALGDEKAFSLVRSGASAAPAPAAKPSFASTPARAATVRRAAPVRSAAASYAAPVAAAAPARHAIEMQVNFGYNSADLTADSRSDAQKFAKVMLDPRFAATRFEIRGHTDAKGGRDYNLDLSRRRAQAVADYLVSQGVPAANIDARGVGFDEPIAGTSATAPVNRRVEFIKAS